MARALLAASLALLLAGCPGEEEPLPDAGEDAGVIISPVEVCDRLSAARCALLSSCYPAFARDTEDSCRTTEQTQCLQRYDQLRTSVDEGKVKVNAEALARCEARLLNAACPATFPPGYPAAASPFSDCNLDGTLQGSVSAGQTCRDQAECEPGSLCFKPNGVCLGTCSKAPAEGEPCAFGCAAGLYCNDQGTPGDLSDDRCGQPKQAGEACADSSECAAELYCAGTCRARGKAGDGCVFDPLRASTCDPGLACDVTPFVQGASGSCVKPRGIGESCRFHWSCEKGLLCGGIDWTGFPEVTPAAGACIPAQPVGASCNFTPFATFVGESCQSGSSCWEDGSCHALGARGEACAPTALSCSGFGVFCKPSPGGTTGTCSGPASIGERCGVAIDAQRTVLIPCSSGYCDPQSLSCLAPNKLLGDLCTSDGECSSSRCAVQQDRTQRCAAACN